MSSADDRGSGFVHLNTPSSIHYTKGQTLSLSDLARPRSRVECVTLPATLMTPWRQATRVYTKLEGYQPFAADLEAERSGEGPVLPPLSAPPAKKAADTPFFQPHRSGTTAAPVHAGPSASLDEGSEAPRGIKIMSHHKVSGVNEFVYPDYDGVLSGGVVPEVIVTAEEKAEKEAMRVFYTSPLVMTTEELEAFEELQALWRSRARSHSALGAQHRQLAGGTLAPGEEDDGRGVRGGRGIEQPSRKRARAEDLGTAADGTAAMDALLEEEAHVDDVTDDMLAEALRMADDLLQLS